jgi:predicted transcriptional regulator
MAADTVFVGAQVDADTHRQLHELAERNSRSAAGEIRLALKERLERQQQTESEERNE